MGIYDGFPPDVRQRLQESPFNLCAACVWDFGAGRLGFHAAIDMMERMMREAGNFIITDNGVAVRVRL